MPTGIPDTDLPVPGQSLICAGPWSFCPLAGQLLLRNGTTGRTPWPRPYRTMLFQEGHCGSSSFHFAISPSQISRSQGPQSLLIPPFHDFAEDIQNSAGCFDFLFLIRLTRAGINYLNRTLIPALCRKAGVPLADLRGNITRHRARSTIASQLYNAGEPMTLFEFAGVAGPRDANSQHYAKITPLKVAKSYADAGYFARNHLHELAAEDLASQDDVNGVCLYCLTRAAECCLVSGSLE